MSTPSGTGQDYSLYYILSLIAFALTGMIITGSIVCTILYAVIGLLFAAFFVNALVKDRDY
jgi:hypothetical protein